MILDVENLPKGAVFVNYESYYVQELIIKTNVTEYKKRRYRLLDGTYISADLPIDIEGHFGNNLKRYIVYQSSMNNVSQAKITQELNDIGIQISEGQVNNIIMAVSEKINKEYEDIMQAGITTAKELRVDDTGGKHKGQNYFTLVVQNDFFTIFVTSPSKSRMQFLKVIRCRYKGYVLNNYSLEYLEKYKLSEQLKFKLLKIKDIIFADKNAWDKALIEAEISPISFGKGVLRHVEEAGILGGAIENGVDPELSILSDGASQFNILINHAGCWVHAERGIKRLIPIDEIDANEIEKVSNDIWNFYNQLKNYKENPNDIEKVTLREKFDEIFSQTVTSEQLTVALKKFRKNKDDLLRVLDLPFIDTHNNSSEHDIRAMVIKGKIFGQTHTEKGICSRDSLGSIVKTCRKNMISVWEFFGDRINNINKIHYLPDLIRQRAKSFLVAPT